MNTRCSVPNVWGKLKRDEVQFFMLHVIADQPTSASNNQLNAFHLDKEHNIPSHIEHLLRKHPHVIAEPASLPPISGPFDHKIPLQPGVKVVNIRPYRYSAMKKYIIEKLVKEMLQQRVI